MAALALALPATAIADTGGTSYSTSKTTSASSTRSTSPTSPRPARERYVHLGDRIPVRRGMHGHDVKVLQDFFNRIGMQVSIDGAFGRGTWAALRRFERRAHRPIDGVLDSRDLTSLRRVVKAGGWSSTASQTPPTLPSGSRARVLGNGTAVAPADAPEVVKQIIAAGNEIATKPYRYGGGHGRWNDTGYDCSGSISYALHGAGLLQTARDSSGFESFGESGRGQWVSIYANAGHAYMVVAGLRFDTSGRSRTGSRWQSASRSSSGYVVRHPAGL
jgi:cell wall-associated NlpC family hydrolase